MHRMIMTTLVVVALTATGAQGHGVTIEGTVTDAGEGTPIPFATVQIDGSNLGTMADSVGQYVLTHVPDGRVDLVFSAVGYSTARVSVTVNGHQNEVNQSLRASQVDAGQIVVTGTRTPRYVKDVPIFTEVVSRASIEDKAAHNIYEALEGESGVKVEQQCQGCNFTILRMQGLSADHTQLLLDGQPVYSGLASVYGLQQLSTADVDRIEIVKGAGSALYGSSAVAGAINIVSSIPQKTEGKVSLEFGEHGTNRYSITAGTRRDNVALFVFAQQTEQDELDETGDSDAPGGVDSPDGWLDRVRATGRNFGFSLYVDNVFAADRMVIRGKLTDETRLGGWLTDNRFENPFAPGTERILTDRFTGQAEYRVWLPDGSEINTSVAVTGHERDATNDTFLSDFEEMYGESPPVDLFRPYIAHEDLLVANLDFVKSLGHGHRLLLGSQFTHNSLEESGMYLDPKSGEPYSSRSKKRAYEFGAFVQDEFKVTDQLELVGGIRYDHHDSEDEFRGSGDVLPQGLEPLAYNESSVNPRFSIKYELTEEFIVRASAGTGFRVPYGFSEDLHLCSGSPRVYKGGTLKPERSVSYSLTADFTGSSFTASANLYRTELRDAIAFAEAHPSVIDMGYTYQWENIDNACVSGIEANGSVSIAGGLVLGARFELFEGKYDHPRADWVGTQYEAISRNISRYPGVSGGLKADLSQGGWNLVADADIKGKMYIDLTEPDDPADVKIHETESYALLNAKLSREFLDRYMMYLGVKNLTDYTQEEKHITDAAFMYAPMYGRMFYAGVRMSL